MAAKITQLLCIFTLAVLTVAITTTSAYGTDQPSYPYQQEQQQQEEPNDLEKPYAPEQPSPVKPGVNLHLDYKTSSYVPKTKAPKVEKPVVPVEEEQPAYVPTKPEVEKPEKPEADEEAYKPEEKEMLMPKNVGVQGLVYCQTGSVRSPIEGAVPIVKCLAEDKYGNHAADISFLCNPTDKHGYFFTPLDLASVLYKVTECKVYLASSPVETCSYPTDINKGVSGALVGPNFHILPHNNMNLFSVGPFIYTPEAPKSTNGGY